jgi:hypothetical protein
MVQNLAKTERFSSKNLSNLMPNFVKGSYIRWLKFCQFCMVLSEQNEAWLFYAQKGLFYLPKFNEFLTNFQVS